jgi:PAS domain S-box-containing protein
MEKAWMQENFRNCGIDSIEDVPWGTHFCQFYQTKEELINILVPYFKAGLENNEFCIWITSKYFSVEETKEILKRAIPNFEVYLKNEQIEIISYINWYLKEGTFDPQKILKGWINKLNKALINGYKGLRFTEDTFWIGKDSRNNFIDYEKRLNSIIRKYPIIGLHTCPLDMYNDTDIIEIASNHHFSLAKVLGKWKRIESSGQKTNNNSKQAEETLYNSETRYRSLYKNSLDAILLTRPDGTILSANPQACNFFGMTEDEIIRAGRKGLVVKDEKLATALEERNLTGRAKAELTFRRKDGSTFVGEASSNVFRDISGSLITSMFIRDVTERKKIEAALREAYEELQLKSEELQVQTEGLEETYEAPGKGKEHYLILFTNMTEGFDLAEVVCNKDGEPYAYRYLEINPDYELQKGISKEREVGRSA